MRKFLRYILLRPVRWATNKFSSRPDRTRIFKALTKLYHDILENQGKKGVVIRFDINQGSIIIFSVKHKGGRNGADDFVLAEPNYLAALEYYDQHEYHLVCLGDSEELWENQLHTVRDSYPTTFELERNFVRRKRFSKVLGNHDLYWGNDPFAWWQIRKIYEEDVRIDEGLILETKVEDKALHIFCTHGHQGDAQSDGNWFSKFFVARIWAPLQAYLRINPNTAAYNNEKKTLHNEIMYEWSAEQKDMLLITGHTHQPVFVSLTHIERLYRQLQFARLNEDEKEIEAIEQEIKRREVEYPSVAVDYLIMKPTYFNSGCCCFVDGDITGIEIGGGVISLIKWTSHNRSPERQVLETISMAELVKNI